MYKALASDHIFVLVGTPDRTAQRSAVLFAICIDQHNNQTIVPTKIPIHMSCIQISIPIGVWHLSFFFTPLLYDSGGQF
jgi:hypothetical protein